MKASSVLLPLPRVPIAVRELKDRWLDLVEAHSGALLLRGKYDMNRPVDGPDMGNGLLLD